MITSRIKKNLVDLVFTILEKSNGHIFTRPLYSGIGNVLVFHRVRPDPGGKTISANSGLEVTPESLEEIIRFFARRDYEFVSLDELYRRLNSGEVANKFVAFTFDDGYADNLTYAYPILKKHQVPFTIYVTTCFPDNTAIIWWYLLEDLILERDRIDVRDGGRENAITCETWNQKETVFMEIRSILLDRHEGDWAATIDSVLGAHDFDLYGHTERLALTWEQIAELEKDPLVTIGAHTTNHYPLNTLPESGVKLEISDSKKRLESELSCPIEHFAYPFGTRNEVGEREFRIVKDSGFKTATTTRCGNIFPEHRHHMECLPRNDISGQRVGRNVNYLNLWVDGTIPCLMNKFERVITA